MNDEYHHLCTLAEVAMQMEEEGAIDEIIDFADNVALGQFGSADDDQLGSMNLTLAAAAIMIAQSPSRPTCCRQCEMDHLSQRLQFIVNYYTRYRRKEMNEGQHDAED